MPDNTLDANNTEIRWTRGVGLAQFIKQLPYKHGELTGSMNLQNNVDMVAHTCKPQCWGDEDRQFSKACWTTRLLESGELQARERPCLKRQGEWHLRTNNTRACSLASTMQFQTGTCPTKPNAYVKEKNSIAESVLNRLCVSQ